MISKTILTATFLSVFLLKAQQNVAYFASGCFWCVEAIFESVEGVVDAQSGYCGGRVLNPTYAEICSGRTGHAETVKVTFRPNKVTYTELLEIFFDSHDPSTLNQQGPDKGTQYRSAVFYSEASQRLLAENYISSLERQKTFERITTTIEKMTKFYPAEKYHQDFVKNNPYHPYVLSVSKPRKLQFLKKRKTLKP